MQKVERNLDEKSKWKSSWNSCLFENPFVFKRLLHLDCCHRTPIRTWVRSINLFDLDFPNVLLITLSFKCGCDWFILPRPGLVPMLVDQL